MHNAKHGHNSAKKKKKVILFNGYQRHNMTFVNKAVVNF